MTSSLRTWAGASGRQAEGCRSFSSAARHTKIDALASMAVSFLLVGLSVTGLDFARADHAVMAQAPTTAPGASATSATDGQAFERQTLELTVPQRETVIAAYGGAPYTYPSDVTIDKPGVHDFTLHKVDWIGKPFDNPVYYGVRVMRWFSGGATGGMLDFTHSKTISVREQTVKFSGTLDGKPAPAEAKISAVFKHLEASHGHNMLTLNGLMRLPSLSARLSPYVGVGAGVSLPHSEVSILSDPARTYEYQFAGPVTQVVAGIEFRLPRLSYFLEYKFSIAPYVMPLSYRDGTFLFKDLWLQAKDWLGGVEPAGGHLTTRLSSHQIIGGIGVRIASPVAVGTP